jgi:hypothetical protein
MRIPAPFGAGPHRLVPLALFAPESVMTVSSYVISQSGWTYTIAVDP